MKEEKQTILLKSAKPELYPGILIECKVIPNDQIGVYLETIPTEDKFYAHKNGKVAATQGFEGEKILTTLKTIIDGREYILNEETNEVKSREFNGKMENDVIVTNISSTSGEQYIVKYEKFLQSYVKASNDNGFYIFEPVPESRLFAKVPENIIIMTSWGEPAICLAGSYIVTYNAEINDYNTVEKGAFESTYEFDGPSKKLN